MPAGGEKGGGAAHAEADHADRADALEIVLGGGDVGHHVLPVEIAEIAARIGDLVRRIAAFEIAHEAVEHRRRHRRIAEPRQPVADRADVMVDAENLLHHDQAAFRRAGRIGAIGAERVLVAGGECELLTQGSLPFISIDGKRESRARGVSSTAGGIGTRPSARGGGEIARGLALIRMQAQLLHPPVQQLGDIDFVLGRAGDFVDPAELLELLARWPSTPAPCRRGSACRPGPDRRPTNRAPGSAAA